jgi:hypothetical protein
VKEIVFLVEEESAKAMLNSLLPRLLPEGVFFRIVPFEGKRDLQAQMTRRIRAYRNPQARFVVLQDQDSHPDCRQLKHSLLRRCADSGRLGQCLVRIACSELESFYLADLAAVERALGIAGLQRRQHSRKFRAPDGLANPSAELRVLTGHRYQKVAGSALIGEHLTVGNDRSASFGNLVAGVRRLSRELLTT